MKINKMSKLEKKNLKWIYLFLLPTVIIFVTFYLVPIITVFITSFTKWNGYTNPEPAGWANYIKLFSGAAFKSSMINMMLWFLIAGTLHVGFGVLIAFILYRKPFGWKLTRTVFMVPNVISMSAWAIIYKFIFNNKIGVLNRIIRIFYPAFDVEWFYTSPFAFWAVTLTWLFYAVVVTLVVYGDLMAIPEELNEAARMDGATGWKLITKIQLPLCRYSIGTSVIMSLTARVSMYEQVALTSGGGPGNDTMSLSIMLIKNVTNMKYGMANAISVIMILAGILVLVVVNKLFRMNENVY